MKPLFCFLLFLFSCYNSPCIAQTGTIKSLLKQLQKEISVDSSAKIYRQLTHLYVKERLYLQALEMAQKELRILEKSSETQRLAEVYFNIASLYRTTANYSKALDFAQQSLNLYKKTIGEKHLETLGIYRFLAQTYYLKEDYKEAESLINLALDGYQKQTPRDIKNEIALQILLGNIHLKRGNYTASQDAFLTAKKYYDNHSKELDLEQLAKIYSNLVSLKLDQYATLEALAYCQKIIEIRKQLYKDENHFSLPTTYINVGSCYIRLNEFEKAIGYYQKSLAILLKAYGKQHDLVASLHNNIGSAFLTMKQQDSAQYHLLESLRIYQTVLGNNSLNSVTPLWQLAKLFRQQKAYFKAEVTLEKAIAIQQLHTGNKHPDLAKMLLDMAYILKEQTFYTKALHYANQAYQSNIHYDRPLDKILMLQIVELQLRLSLQLSIKEMTTAFDALDNISSIMALVQLELNSTTDQQNLIQNIRTICEQGIEVCYQLYKINPQIAYLQKAFQLIEYNKAVLLSTQLKQHYHYTTTPSQKEQQVLLQKNLAEIQFLEQQWQKAEHLKDSLKAETLQQRLFELHQSYGQQTQQLYKQLNYHRPIELAVLQKQLGADEHIYNFFYGHFSIYKLEINSKGTILSKINLDLEDTLKHFSEYLLNLDKSKKQLQTSCQVYDNMALKLYQTLVNSKHQNLLIIPDDLLHYLPFEALTTKATNNPKGFHQLNYALHQHNISYAYSATSYYYQQYKHLNKANSQVLGFAPNYHQHPLLQELKSTTLETSFLESQFKGDYYYDNDANKVTFLKECPLFGIIHLAAHGFADEHELHQAQLFFTYNKTDSNAHVLYPFEVVQQSLDADLVVLSACQTAIGYWQEGEGVMSLARDFMFAGAASVLTTLWQVNDQSSALIIQDFYAHLSNMPKNNSLQISKQNYLKNASAFSAHPYFWAGYILLGNTHRVDIDNHSPIKLRHIGVLFFISCIIILYLGRKRLVQKRL